MHTERLSRGKPQPLRLRRSSGRTLATPSSCPLGCPSCEPGLPELCTAAGYIAHLLSCCFAACLEDMTQCYVTCCRVSCAEA
jgi:hypothetical protein